jgi:hypothetical protein
MATQMVAGISEALSIRFLAVDFFARPTVAGIADRVDALRAAPEVVASDPAAADRAM